MKLLIKILSKTNETLKVTTPKVCEKCSQGLNLVKSFKQKTLREEDVMDIIFSMCLNEFPKLDSFTSDTKGVDLNKIREKYTQLVSPDVPITKSRIKEILK